jgi:predicted DNA-binding ribbon-helix-helix protein
METKSLNKLLTKQVDKFAAVAVAYENGIATEVQLKKSACDQVAVFLRLKEAESLKVDNLIDSFTAVIKAERQNISSLVTVACTELYNKINETKE